MGLETMHCVGPPHHGSLAASQQMQDENGATSRHASVICTEVLSHQWDQRRPPVLLAFQKRVRVLSVFPGIEGPYYLLSARDVCRPQSGF